MRTALLDCIFFNFRSGAGGHYGTFSGQVAAFTPQTKAKKAYMSSGKNFVTNPLKNGTGYGYVNVLIGKPQTYSINPYDKAKELRKVFLVYFIKIYNEQKAFLP